MADRHVEIKTVLDINDDIDRPKMKASNKLEYICMKAKLAFGKDPRAGGFSFVGRVYVVEKALQDLAMHERRLAPPIAVGTNDADIVFSWSGVPFRVRHEVRDDNIWVMRDDQIKPSTMQERQAAGQLRMEANSREIRIVS